MPVPQQQKQQPKAAPMSSAARAKTDAAASAGLRTLAMQFEATGKWAQAIKCYDASLAIAHDEPRVEASVRLACARLLLRHAANVADARQQLERARLLLNTVKDAGGTGGGVGGEGGTTTSAASPSFSVLGLRCAVFSELATVHVSLGSAKAAADALSRGASAAAAAAASASASASHDAPTAAAETAAAWQAHFATRAAALSSRLHGGIFASSSQQLDPLLHLEGACGGGGGAPWLSDAPPLAAAAVALARGASAAHEPGRGEEAVEFVKRGLNILEEMEAEATKVRESERAAKEEALGGGDDGDASRQKQRKSGAGDAVPVPAAEASPPPTTTIYPSRTSEIASAARLRAHGEALRVAISLSSEVGGGGGPVAELGVGDGGRSVRLADSLAAAVGASAAASEVAEAEEAAAAAAVAAVAAGAAVGGGGGGAKRKSIGGDAGALRPPPPPLPHVPSLAEDAGSWATAAACLATAAAVLRPLCKFTLASVQFARGLEVCDEGLSRLAGDGAGVASVGGSGEGDGSAAAAMLESSLPAHVAAAAAPLVAAKLVLLDSRARCWLSHSDIAAARSDVAAALREAARWPRASAPLLAPLLLPLAGIYCLCCRELRAARAFLGAAAAAAGPRAYQLQAQRTGDGSAATPAEATPSATPARRSPSTPIAFAPPQSNKVQPPAGPASPGANAAYAAAHAAFSELADPSPSGGGPAARATGVLKAGLSFPSAPAAGPGCPRTHRATAQLALGCTLSAAAEASEASAAAAAACGDVPAKSRHLEAAREARAMARAALGSCLAAAQRNLGNMQLTAFALAVMSPLLAFEDEQQKAGGVSGGGAAVGFAGGGAAGGDAGASEPSAAMEASRTLFFGALDIAKQIDCPAAVLAAASRWMSTATAPSAGGKESDQEKQQQQSERAASEAYIARYEARAAKRIAEAKGSSVVDSNVTEEDGNALAEAAREHAEIVGWVPLCQQ